MIGIYKITNKVNNKCYIGQSIHIERRWRDHKNKAFSSNDKNYENPLYRAIRKYGLDNFSFEVLESCSINELDDKEKYYIQLYESYTKKGYNQDEGGSGAKHGKLTWDKVYKIKEKLKTTTISTTELAKEFHIAPRTLRALNGGETWVVEGEQYPVRKVKKEVRHNYCIMCGKEIALESTLCPECVHIKQQRTTRPEPLVLAKIVIEQGFEEAGRQFSVSGKTISKWFKSWGLPDKKKEIEDWYYKETNQEPPQKQIIERKPMSEIMKPVKQIDIMTGKTLNTFESASAAVRFLNRGQHTHITEVCKGRRKTAYGYVWEFV